MHFSVELHAGFSYKEGSLVVLSLPAQVSGDMTVAFDSPTKSVSLPEEGTYMWGFDVNRWSGRKVNSYTGAYWPFQREVKLSCSCYMMVHCNRSFNFCSSRDVHCYVYLKHSTTVVLLLLSCTM